MSRAAQSKSRAEKKGQSAPTPAVTHEIVPGKYTDVDWNRMLEFDDGEDFISDIVDELVTGTLDQIYKKYIDRQLLPYTISQAKEALLTIVDWRFLACDPGETDPSTDPNWQEDEEPIAAVPDCWAQGSVPKTFVYTEMQDKTMIKDETTSIIEEPIAEEPELDVELEEQAKPWEVNEEDLLKSDEPETTLPAPEQETTDTKIVPTPPQPTKSKKRQFRPHKGRLLSAGVSNMHESLEDTERKLTTEEKLRTVEQAQDTGEKTTFNPMPKSVGSILKQDSSYNDNQEISADTEVCRAEFQSGRPPGSRDVYYDDQGNVIAMSKINPERLPTHRIKTKYHVVDPATEAAQTRLDAMRTGRYLATKPKKQTLPTSDKTKLEKSSLLDYRSIKSNGSAFHKTKYTGGRSVTRTTDAVTPLPPPMIESMELAPGVLVREGDRVKRGPRQLHRAADRLPNKDILRPVGVDSDLNISVKELLGGKSPLVRIETTPVPPIIGKQNVANFQKIQT